MKRTPWSDYYPAAPASAGRTITGLQVRTMAVLDRAATKTGVRHLEGIAVPYNTWSDVGAYLERIAPGTFADSIRATPNLPLLAFHNSKSWPVGVAVDWHERADGLHGVWRIDTEDPAAAEALRKVSEGYVTGLSVGFQPDPDADVITRDKSGTAKVTRHRARLLEVSLVPTPAYAGAKVTKIRAATP